MTSMRRTWTCAAILWVGLRGVRHDECRAGGDDAAPPAVPAPTAAAKAVELTTWEGFLWVSAEGWTRIGVPLVAEQFMEGAPYVVEPPLSDRLRSIDGAVPAFAHEPAFWYGTALAREDWEPQRRSEPRILVKLRGQAASTIVHLSLDESPKFGGDDRAPAYWSPVSLRDAHLVAVERLDPKWLAAWREVFVRKGSPWISGKDGWDQADPELRREVVKASIDALAAMRAVTPADDDLRLAARKVDPDARLSTKFRHRVENGVQRFLVDAAKELRVTLPASLADRMLPPSDDALRWFEDAKTRAEFLARAALNWKGDPEDLAVAHYVDDGRGSTWQQLADLETVRNAWSDARYAKIRATTLEVAAREKEEKERKRR